MLSAEFSRSVARRLAELGVAYTDIAEAPTPAWVPPAPVSLIEDDVVFEGQSLRDLMLIKPQRSLDEVLERFGAVMVEAGQKRACPEPKTWQRVVQQATGLTQSQVRRFIAPVQRLAGVPIDYREEMRGLSAQMVALLAYTYSGGVLFDKVRYFAYAPPGREIVGVVSNRLYWPGFPSDERGWASSVRGARPYLHAAASAKQTAIEESALKLWSVLGSKHKLPQTHPLRLAVLVIAYVEPATFRRSGMWVKIAQFRNNHYNIEQALQWRDVAPQYQYNWLLSNLCPAVLTRDEFRSVFQAPKKKYDVDGLLETHRQWDEALAQLTPTRLPAA